ncbi:hypothetical protein BJ322DRAFT_999049, partial [Thelephora terrestris]
MPASNDRSGPKIVTVSVPLNTAVVGGLVARRELRISSDVTFADFYSRMCTNMDLDPTEASIGYKFHTDRARDPPCELSNESDYLPMMQEMVRKILAARSRNPVLFLHNLRPATRTPVLSKRKRDDEPMDSKDGRPRPSTTLDYTQEYRELLSKLRCKLHEGRLCRVDPVTTEHNELNIYQVTLWARMIATGQATYGQPPNSSAFDHVRKRQRFSVQHAPVPASAPSIHVH